MEVMPAGQLIFSQLTDWIHPEQFRRCVDRYQGHYKVYNFPCWDQFLAMVFAQITYRESLADIEICLRSRPDQLYRMGFRSMVSHSTLAEANRVRDWRIYADLAQLLIARARRLYAQEPLAVELEQTVYALDSTTIDLCLSLFPWARFRASKAAIKLHTLLDVRGPIPTMLWISDGKEVDMSILDELVPEPGAFYVMDRGYLDFERLYWLERVGAYFVTRAKTHRRLRRVRSRKVNKKTGVRSDQIVRPAWRRSAERYRQVLRRIHYQDPATGHGLVFLTNNFDLPARTIAPLYKGRWQVELFFKWIKQNLRIKHFYGTSPNAVKTQVWIAIGVYVLVAILRKELGREMSLSQILQILSVNVFEQVPLPELVAKIHTQNHVQNTPNQLMLWD
jgi:hypothetical protein